VSRYAFTLLAHRDRGQETWSVHPHTSLAAAGDLFAHVVVQLADLKKESKIVLLEEGYWLPPQRPALPAAEPQQQQTERPSLLPRGNRASSDRLPVVFALAGRAGS
jgi:hypothetical protein